MLVWRLAALSVALCAFAPSFARAETAYIIQPGDQLQVMVFGGPGITAIQVPLQVQPATTIAPLSQAVTVLADGTISYPLIGSIHVAGLTPDAAGKLIAGALTAYVRHPTVSVLVAKSTPSTIKVLGSVDHNGQIELQKGDRLADVLAKAGVSSYSYPDLNHITVNRVVDGVRHVYNYDLYNMLLNADDSADPLLQPGDVVYVPKARQVNQAAWLNLPFGLYYLYLLLTPGVNHSGAIP
ncbi:MAG TPA: polysaccharide biosynthesis/export family protein [Candidatus Cybelea sp.]|nr:polysaccharide biosynthesis/export family protein [Candidatus Cybelea sp.]